jgi:hypothetical protein
VIDITRPPSTRIFGIVARKAPRVLILRRGPCKQVLAIMWHTDSDEFHAGQWFKGRIHEHRCDLSPSDSKLIYFAESHRGPYQQWTAISRPPFLTALSLWAGGGAYGGGGIFDGERSIRLNHGARTGKPEKDFRLAPSFSVNAYRVHENPKQAWPLERALRQRNDWKWHQQSEWKQTKVNGRLAYQLIAPEVWRKARGVWILESALTGLGAPDEPHRVFTHRILDAAGNEALKLGRSDWADWSIDGQILLGRAGRLWRVPMSHKAGPGEPRELIDLRLQRFVAAAPPEEALSWTGENPLGRRIR